MNLGGTFPWLPLSIPETFRWYLIIIIRQPLGPVVGRIPQHAVSKLPCLVLSSAISCRSNICPGRLSTGGTVWRENKRGETEVVWTCIEERWWVYWEKDADYGVAMKEETGKVKKEVYGCGERGHG